MRRRRIRTPLICTWFLILSLGAATLMAWLLLLLRPQVALEEAAAAEEPLEKAKSLNRTPESHWLVLNHVPHCGGQSLAKVLEVLSPNLGFRHWRHPHRTPWARFLLPDEQKNLVTWFEYQHLPVSYDRHFFYVNFTPYQRYVRERPIYINMIRDPADRLSDMLTQQQQQRSKKRQMQHQQKLQQQDLASCILLNQSDCNTELQQRDFTLSVPFFCGQHPHCVEINNPKALQMAKRTAETAYSVIGLWEEPRKVLLVLQAFVPKFFSNASHALAAGLDAWIDKESIPPVSPEARKRVEDILWAEVELYEFLKRRLSLQFQSIQNISTV